LQSVDLTITTEITIPLMEASNEQTSNVTYINQLATVVAQAVVKKITAAVVDGSFVSTLMAVYEQQAATTVVRAFSVSPNITASSVIIVYPPSPEPTIAPTNAPKSVSTTDSAVIMAYVVVCTFGVSLLFIFLRYWQLKYAEKAVHPDPDDVDL
jgi:hypothetical protein